MIATGMECLRHNYSSYVTMSKNHTKNIIIINDVLTENLETGSNIISAIAVIVWLLQYNNIIVIELNI